MRTMMKKKLLAALVLSLALAMGLMPAAALAASGGLSAGETSLTADLTTLAQTSNGISVSPSPCHLGTGQKAIFTTVSGATYMGSISSSFIWDASYYGRFTVLKGGKVLASEKVGLSVGGNDDYAWYEGSYSFKPTKAGTYKVRFSFMSGSTEMDRYEKSFKVKKVTALKSYKPTFSVDCVLSESGGYSKLVGLNGKTQIFRATSKGGKYKLIATTTKASYADKKAKAGKGKDYWYKTRVIGKSGSKTYKSKLSAPKCNNLLFGTPNVPTITRAASTIDGVELKWKKTPKKSAPYGCYYYVERSTQKSGGYKGVASIRQDNDGTLYLFDSEGELSSSKAFIDKTAEEGQTYYYRIRAAYELKWNDKKVYGNPVAVKA